MGDGVAFADGGGDAMRCDGLGWAASMTREGVFGVRR